jgi:hypothetical protein
MRLRELTDPRLLPTRRRLFHRGRVLVARDHVEARPDKDPITDLWYRQNWV